MQPAGEPRKSAGIRMSGAGYPRLALTLTMILLLMIVMFIMFRILPQREEPRLSSRRAAGLIDEAVQWEGESFHWTAAENYQRVMSQHHLRPATRAEAAHKLSRLYADVLGQPAAACAALEKAIILTKSGPERQRLVDRLDDLRKSLPPAVHRLEESLGGVGLPTFGPGEQGEVIATIGDRVVTLEEILFAWSIMNGREKPEPEKLEPFVHHYLDMILIAREAERLDLHRGTRIRHDLDLKRLIALNQAMMKHLIGELENPDREILEAYYRENPGRYLHEPRMVIAYFSVDQVDHLDRVIMALRSGDSFQQVALQHGIGKESPETCIRMAACSPDNAELEGIGNADWLVSRLVGHEDGYTTGPFEIRDQWFWFRVLEQEGPQVMPFEVVEEELLLHYQQRELPVSRHALLNRLKNEQSVEIINAPEEVLTHPVVKSSPVRSDKE